MVTFWNKKKASTATDGDSIAVSVLVPICNVERYLPECLDSLAAQTLNNIEVICLDDGSIDNSGAIVDEYAARFSNFRVVHKVNTGYGHTMNLGLDLARGEYVGIVESDDYAATNMFKTLYKLASRRKLDVVKCGYFEHSEVADVPIEPYWGIPCKHVINPLDYAAIYGTTPCIWTGLYRRAFLTGCGIRFVESPGASFQDTGFIYKVWSAAKRCMLIHRPLLFYRTDNAGSSVKSSKKVYALCDEHASVADFLKTLPPEHAHKATINMQQAKLGTYRWNYNRIAPEYHLKFAQHIAAEFKEAEQVGLLDRSTFRPGNWKLLQQLVASPQDFCDSFPDEIPWEFE